MKSMKAFSFIALALLLSGCFDSDRGRISIGGRQTIYTEAEVEAMRPNDTIYVEFVGEYLPAVVVKNERKLRLMMIKRANLYGDYNDFCQQEIRRYDEL